MGVKMKVPLAVRKYPGVVQPRRRPHMDNSSLCFHRYANLFPMMGEDEFASLVENIKSFGLRDRIWLFQDQILDGRNRYLACEKAGVMPQFQTFRGDEQQALEAVLSWNLERRHLNAGQKAMVALEVLPEFERLAREKQKEEASKGADYGALGGRGNKKPLRADLPEGVLEPKPETKPPAPRPRDIAAKTVGASARNVQNAKKIVDERPDLAEKVREGKVTINRAIQEIKQVEREQAAAQETQSSLTRPVIHCKDAIDWLASIEPVDLILTDPPYSTDIDDIAAFAKSWLPLALSKLKPTGRAFVCIGAYPKELHAYLSVAMPEQILGWTYRNTLGPSPSHKYKLNWQAILYFVGVEAPPLDCPVMLEQFSIQDISAPDGRQGDRYHAWQKPLELGERFVRHSTTEGQTVADPFACTGTFLIAAAKLGRFAIGCDISSENLALAAKRGCDVIL